MTTRVMHSLLVAVILSSSVIAEDPVHFADPALKAVVESTLLINNPTPTDMLNLTELRCVNKGVTSITGLEHAANLQELSLRYNNVVSISALSGLTQLRELNLSQNKIVNLSPLSNLTNLQHLDLHENEISNVSPLSSLTNLKTLIMKVNKISDISPLSSLVNLRHLVLRSNTIKNISPLSGMIDLEELHLHDNQISNITSLNNLVKLEDLGLQNNNISSISALSGMADLRILNLKGNKVGGISVLSGCPNLEILNLQQNQIKDVSALSGLTHLRRVELEWNANLNDSAYCRDLARIVSNNPGLSLDYSPNSDPPADLSATDGLYPDKIQISWDAVCNGPVYTTYYQVSRSASDEAARVPVSGWQTALSFDDTTAESGMVYTYWVQTATSPEGSNASTYSSSDTGWLSVQPSLSISSSVGGSVLLPGEGEFSYSEQDVVDIAAESHDPLLFSFSHWTGTAVDAGKVADANLLSTSVLVDGDYTLRAQFVSFLDTLYVDNNMPDAATANGSFQYPLSRIQDAIEVALEGGTIRVGSGIYHETLALGDKAIRLIGHDPNSTVLASFPVIDGNGLGPVVRFVGNEDSNSLLEGFVLTGGLAETGAAIHCGQSSPQVTHCLIVGNHATDPNGGAVWCHDSQAEFVNCTMTDNLGGMVLFDSDVEVVNTILWGNTYGDLSLFGQSAPAIRYSDLGGGWDLSVGNIDADPLFVRPGYWSYAEDANGVWVGGDYHLRSEWGRWTSANSVESDENTQQWIMDAVTSVCIDGGDPSDGVGYEPVPHGERINMGVYGGTSQASRSKE